MSFYDDENDPRLKNRRRAEAFRKGLGPTNAITHYQELERDRIARAKQEQQLQNRLEGRDPTRTKQQNVALHRKIRENQMNEYITRRDKLRAAERLVAEKFKQKVAIATAKAIVQPKQVVMETPLFRLEMELTSALASKIQASYREVLEVAQAAVAEEAQAVIADSQPLVPVDTGSLKASAWVEDDSNSDQILVRFGYGYKAVKMNPKTFQMTNEYALEVHENMDTHHNVGQAKYLEAPFIRRYVGMERRIGEKIKTALGR